MGPQGAYLVNFLGSLIFSLDFIDPNRNGLNIKNTNYGMSLSLPQNLKINVFKLQIVKYLIKFWFPKRLFPLPKIHALQGLSVLQSNILLLMTPIVVLPVTISANVKCKKCLEKQNFNWRKNFIKNYWNKQFCILKGIWFSLTKNLKEKELGSRFVILWSYI